MPMLRFMPGVEVHCHLALTVRLTLPSPPLLDIGTVKEWAQVFGPDIQPVESIVVAPLAITTENWVGTEGDGLGVGVDAGVGLGVAGAGVGWAPPPPPLDAEWLG
ncbi:MAG: hypothetical protein ACYCZN_01915 [Candidatus Dormibacteria bacterium]